MKYVSVRKLLSDSFQLAFAGCEIVRDYYEKRTHFPHYTKSSEDDLVTEADYKVQTMMIKGFKMNFPELRIIGEENEEYSGQIGFDMKNLHKEVFPKMVDFQQKVPLSQICAWIDPIDSTKGMIDGNMQDVSVLIGFSQNNAARFGVIGIPYFLEGKQLVYKPSIYVGSIGDQKSYEYSIRNQGKWHQLHNPHKRLGHNLQMTVSNSPQDRLQQVFKRKLVRQNKWVGGAGHRISMVLRGQSCLAVYSPGWTCKWDTCAGEAIIKSLGGNFSDREGNSIVYDPDLDEIKNKNGIICTMDDTIYQDSLEAYKQYMLDVDFS